MNKRLLIAALLPLMGGLVSTPLMADDCTPYINGVVNEGITLKVHGTKLYYGGANPESWHFSILTAANLGSRPPLSDETDHFEMHSQSNTSAGVLRREMVGQFTEVNSHGRDSIYNALVFARGYGGRDARVYFQTPSGYRTYMVPQDCYRINNNPKQFAMKGSYSNGSWIYNNWLFSIERMD